MSQPVSQVIFPEDGSTALSPKVHHIICRAGISQQGAAQEAQSEDGVTLLSTDGLIQCDSLVAALPAQPNGEYRYEYFVECAEALAPLFDAVRRKYEQLHMPEFTTTYGDLLKWTSCPQLVCRCFELLKEDRQAAAIHSLLLSTAILERSLGDVYLLKGTNCPTMMKDLFTTRQLLDTFGKTVIQLLHIIMGPPISLNLRNVIWHGFPSPGDIHSQYACFVLCVLASLGQILAEKGIKNRVIPHRAFITFTHMDNLQASLLEVKKTDIAMLTLLFGESRFVMLHRRPLWDLALQQFAEERYGECMILLLPQLEHALRRVFATVNKCTHRILTAENTVLFTTFDEILCRYLPDGSENQVRYTLGDNIMSILLDLLMYPEGPRIRDRLSHGEVDATMVTETVAGHLVAVCAAICAMFMEPHSQLLYENDLLCRVTQKVENYESIFHPISLLKSQIMKLSSSLSKWKSLPRPSSDLLWRDRVKWEFNPEEAATDEPFAKKVFHHITSTTAVWKTVNNTSLIMNPFEDITGQTTEILQHAIATLYRGQSCTMEATLKTVQEEGSRKEEIVGLLRRIAHESWKVSEQVQDVVRTRFGPFDRKELRSRQRNTYRRMLDSIPCLSCGLRCVLLIVLTTLYTLDDITARTSQQQVHMVKWLKWVLQCCENLHTYSNIERNKWEEACTLVTELQQRTLNQH